LCVTTGHPGCLSWEPAELLITMKTQPSRGLFVSLEREPFWNVRIAQKNYFEQKRLGLASRDGLDAHGRDQVSHARGDDLDSHRTDGTKRSFCSPTAMVCGTSADAISAAWTCYAEQSRSLPTGHCVPAIRQFGAPPQQRAHPIPNTSVLGIRISPRSGMSATAGAAS
jgi:hypothetical protein